MKKKFGRYLLKVQHGNATKRGKLVPLIVLVVPNVPMHLHNLCIFLYSCIVEVTNLYLANVLILKGFNFLGI